MFLRAHESSGHSQEVLKSRGQCCRCIRCREVGSRGHKATGLAGCLQVLQDNSYKAEGSQKKGIQEVPIHQKWNGMVLLRWLRQLRSPFV